jgi:nucleoside-diphosphate-sugar epimerase
MKVLITGATGLLGFELCRQLSKNDVYDIKCLVRKVSPKLPSNVNQCIGDLLDINSIQEALNGVDMVIHAAAMVSFQKKYEKTLFETNVEGTTNLVNSCDPSKIVKFIHVSSVAAIGKPSNALDSKDTVIVDENFKWQDSPHNSLYGKSKYLAELEVWRAHAEGLKVVIVNPSIILGEGEWTKSSTQLFRYVYNENKFYTSGHINYIDVQDVVKSIIYLMEGSIEGERFILNSGKVSFKDFFDKIAQSFKKKSPTILLNRIHIEILWRVEKLRSILTGSNPIITKETSLTARSNIYFDNKKIKMALPFAFKELDATINRVTNYFTNQSKNLELRGKTE